MNYLVREPNYLISQLMKLLMKTDDHFRRWFFYFRSSAGRVQSSQLCLNLNQSQGGLASSEGVQGEGAALFLPVSVTPPAQRLGIQPQRELAPCPYLLAPPPFSIYKWFKDDLFVLDQEGQQHVFKIKVWKQKGQRKHSNLLGMLVCSSRWRRDGFACSPRL